MNTKVISKEKKMPARAVHLALCCILTLFPVAMFYIWHGIIELFIFSATCLMIITVISWCSYIKKYHKLSNALFIGTSLANSILATLAVFWYTANRLDYGAAMLEMGDYSAWHGFGIFKVIWITFSKLYEFYYYAIVPLLVCITGLVIVYAVLYICKKDGKISTKSISKGKMMGQRVAHLALCLVLTLIPVAMFFFWHGMAYMFVFTVTCVMLMAVALWCTYIKKHHKLSNPLIIGVSLSSGILGTVSSFFFTPKGMDFAYVMEELGTIGNKANILEVLNVPELAHFYYISITPLLICITALVVAYACACVKKESARGN